MGAFISWSVYLGVSYGNSRSVICIDRIFSGFASSAICHGLSVSIDIGALKPQKMDLRTVAKRSLMNHLKGNESPPDSDYDSPA